MPRETTVSGMPAVGGGGAWLLLPSTITCHSNSTAANPSVAMTRRANAPGTMLAKAYDPVEAPTRTPSIVQEYESKSPSGSDAAIVNVPSSPTFWMLFTLGLVDVIVGARFPTAMVSWVSFVRSKLSFTRRRTEKIPWLEYACVTTFPWAVAPSAKSHA